MITILLIIAGVLGTLSFLEPCTIATHTLFSVRVHQQNRNGRLKSLLAIWTSRSLLLSVLLIALVVLTKSPHWGFYWPGIVLAAMATLYIVSRFTYVPVPHLQFYKLLPKGKALPHSVQLGLTLPACTIPLFLIVAASALMINSVTFAALAGLLFATWFTFPVAIIAFTGIHHGGQNLLNNAAKASPFFTAGLLYGAAFYLILFPCDLIF
ncbi:MAG: hypothetical protein GWP06_08410 [Actinobacteria bacterium]|nr:hypothetical protein [Actinomycetota bacterium]